jgi:hypothetical protein
MRDRAARTFFRGRAASVAYPLAVQFFFAHDGLSARIGAGASCSSEHWTSGRCYRRELHESDRLREIVENSFHPAAHQVRLMPEPRPAGIAQEILPPGPVGFGTRPREQRTHVAPVLTHSHVHRKHRINHRLVHEQSIRLSRRRIRNLRPKSEQRLEPRQPTRSGYEDKSTVWRFTLVGIAGPLHKLTTEPPPTLFRCRRVNPPIENSAT